jgi:hypothetical protein
VFIFFLPRLLILVFFMLGSCVYDDLLYILIDHVMVLFPRVLGILLRSCVVVLISTTTLSFQEYILELMASHTMVPSYLTNDHDSCFICRPHYPRSLRKGQFLYLLGVLCSGNFIYKQHENEQTIKNDICSTIPDNLVFRIHHNTEKMTKCAHESLHQRFRSAVSM